MDAGHARGRGVEATVPAAAALKLPCPSDASDGGLS